MPVVHEREDGELYIKSRMADKKYCTWQVSAVGEEILFSFGLAEDKTKISRYSLYLLIKNKLIFTNNSGFSVEFNNEKLSDVQKQEMTSRERQFINEVRRMGASARGAFSLQASKKPLKKTLEVKPAGKIVKKDHVGPNFRELDADIFICLICQKKFTQKGITKHLEQCHDLSPVEEVNVADRTIEKMTKDCSFGTERNQNKASKEGFILCPVCGVELKNLAKHMKKVHSEEPIADHDCVIYVSENKKFAVQQKGEIFKVFHIQTKKVLATFLGKNAKIKSIQKANTSCVEAQKQKARILRLKLGVS